MTHLSQDEAVTGDMVTGKPTLKGTVHLIMKIMSSFTQVAMQNTEIFSKIFVFNGKCISDHGLCVFQNIFVRRPVFTTLPGFKVLGFIYNSASIFGPAGVSEGSQKSRW